MYRIAESRCNVDGAAACLGPDNIIKNLLCLFAILHGTACEVSLIKPREPSGKRMGRK